MGEMRNSHKTLLKTQFGKLRCKWENDVSMEIEETGYESVNWIWSRHRVLWTV
jgi:hypothetical protein